MLSSFIPLTTALPGRGSTGAQGASRAEGRPRSAVCSWRGGLHVARTNELGDPEQVPVRSARRPYRGAACTAKDVLAFRRPPTVVAEHTLHRREMAQYTSGLVAIMDSLRQKRAPSPYRPSQAPALEGVSPRGTKQRGGCWEVQGRAPPSKPRGRCCWHTCAVAAGSELQSSLDAIDQISDR